MREAAESSEPPASLAELLEEQYQVTEAFANAQTRLWNATTREKSSNEHGNSSRSNPSVASSNTSPAAAVQAHARSRQDVRNNLQALQYKLDGRHPQHLDLSRRVVKTIANNPSWHANGIPCIGADAASMLRANTVAMASLKASMVAVLQQEEGG